MSRLIDADAITKSTELVKKIVVHDFTPYIKAEDLLQFIDKLPTAYNVDKVVEQLEAKATEHVESGNAYGLDGWHMHSSREYARCEALDEAIKIVKAGGVE